MVRKSIFTVLCTFIVLTAYCYNFEEGGIYYEVTSTTNMTVAVTYGDKYGEYAGVITIPNQVSNNGKTYYVTSIGPRAFRSCTGLSTVNLNSYIKTIGSYAFSGCNALHTISIPKNVTSIGDYAFSGCVTLKFVTFEDATSAISLGHGAMNGSNYGLFADGDLRFFYWGRPLSYDTSYGRSPIANQKNLNDITIGPSVTTLTGYMFYGNSAITSFELPSTVTSLGANAFRGFTGLTSFTIPKQITSISDYAFADCYALTSLEIPEWVTSIGNGAFWSCTSLTSFTIPGTLNNIGNYAFANCVNLKKIVFEKGLDVDKKSLTLGYGANDGPGYGLFYDCPIESVDLQRELTYNTSYEAKWNNSTTTYSNRSPFRNHPTLKKATIGEDITYVYNFLFYNDKYLEEVNIPATSETIGQYTFYGCESLKSIAIPASVTSIKNWAFAGCTRLTSFTIPGTLNSIDNYAFANCVNLKEIIFEKGLDVNKVKLTLGYGANDGPGYGLFYDCPIESVDLQRELTYYTSYEAKWNNSTTTYSNRSPFRNHPTLKKATIGEDITYVYNFLFYNDKYLEEVNIPATSETIGQYTFYGCESLKSIAIPASVTSINNWAFAGCTGLTSFTIPGTLNSIGNYAFANCTGISRLIFEKGKEIGASKLTLGYGANDGPGYGLFYDCPIVSVDLQRDLTYNTSYEAKWNNSTTTYSNRSPFRDHPTLIEVNIGEDAVSVKSNLFRGDLFLKSVSMADAITSIGSCAFYNCETITSLVLPHSLETIGDYAFNGCKQLTGLIFHPALKSIGNYAFQGCVAFNNFAIEESEETLALGNGSSEGEKTGLFKDCPITSVFIGRNLSYNYSPLANMATLTEARFGNPVTRIPNYIFQGDTELSSVVFNKSCELQSVGKYAFDGCINLPTPQFPSTVTAFDEGAFKGCVTFTNFDLPENLVTIGAYTFQDCTGLTEFKIPATTTGIGNYAFSGCTGVKQVVFADGEETLALGYGASNGKGYGLFNDCPLESLYLGRTLSYTEKKDNGYSPFAYVSTLSEITIGPKVKSLGYCIFYSTAISELYLPSSVRTIHSSSFNRCNNLKTLVILGVTPPTLDDANTFLSNSAEDSKIYVFFPDNYKSTKIWKDYTDKIEAVGEIYSNFTYSGEGHVIGYKTDFPIVLDNRDTEAKDAGTYQKRIDVTYTTNGYNIKDVLDYEYTIKKAPLTITAESCSRNYGEENPEFRFIYDGFVNDEDEKILTKEPTATTKATVDSPAGEYDIVVSGAEAKNYDISYINGVLTIVSIIKGDVNSDGEVNAQDIVDLTNYIAGYNINLIKEKADVNGDGVVNSADVIMVSKTILSK